MHDPRYDTSTKVSCGTCVPCLLRKISMAAYDLEKYDNEYDIPYEGNMDEEEYRSSLNYYTTFYDYIKLFRSINRYLNYSMDDIIIM